MLGNIKINITISLCYHQIDFGIKCEWHFFGTSHGKNSCDGIGGTVKRAVAMASLKRFLENQILSAQDMYSFLTNSNFSDKINFFLFVQKMLKKLKMNLLKDLEKLKL